MIFQKPGVWTRSIFVRVRVRIQPTRVRVVQVQVRFNEYESNISIYLAFFTIFCLVIATFRKFNLINYAFGSCISFLGQFSTNFADFSIFQILFQFKIQMLEQCEYEYTRHPNARTSTAKSFEYEYESTSLLKMQHG